MILVMMLVKISSPEGDPNKNSYRSKPLVFAHFGKDVS